MKGFLKKFLGTETKKLRRNYVTTLSSPKISSHNKTFLKHRRVPKEIFQYCDAKKTSTEKRDIPLSLIQNFLSLPTILGSTEDFPMKLLGTVRPKTLMGNTLYPPGHQKKFSLPEIFCNNEEFPLKNFDTVI